jgi:DNA-binding LacI/PurR family transcriptional regulator
MTAIGVLHGLHQAGIQVPDEISITGFDNIVFSAFTKPALTTFDQPKRFIGAEAARLLLDLLRIPVNEKEIQQPKIRMLKGKLLVRESTAAPAIF